MCRSVAPSRPDQTRQSFVSGGIISSTGTGVDNSTSQQLAEHVARLLDIVRSQRWPAFERIALSNPRVFQIICSTISYMEEFKRLKTMLHACLCHDPPFEIVAKILMMLPDPNSALRAQDYKGRTPLHVAAAFEADPMVIKLLGSTDPVACTMLDEDSRTPLHLACDTSFSLFQGTVNEHRSRQQRNAPSYNAVHALLSDSLAAATVEDEGGMNALECAILSGASLELVTLLQKATMKSMRERKRRRLF